MTSVRSTRGRRIPIVEVKERRGGRDQLGCVIRTLIPKGSVLNIDTTSPFSARSGHATTAVRRMRRGDLPSDFANRYGGSSLMHRGDRREPIFRANADRQFLLDVLGEAFAKTNWPESGEAKAERCVRKRTAWQGVRETDLRRRQSDPTRIRIARRLWAETTMTLASMERRLQLGLGRM